MRSKIPLVVAGILALGTTLVMVSGAGRDTGEKNTEIKESLLETESYGPSEVNIEELGMSSHFDEQENPEQSSDESRKMVSLMASSSKKNINVLIADDNGNPVKGEEFHIYLTSSDGNVREYADYDLDGFIHAKELPSGKYNISLIPTEEYKMISSVDVKIREEVEYASVARIIELIKNESEVDTETEDTANMREEDDGSLLESGDIELEGGSLGIDVSRYNKEIDWDSVKESGVEFAIIRLGYRGSASGVLVEDSMFKRNYEQALAAGMKIGVYFVTQAVTEAEAEEEAEMVAALTNASELSTPVFLDVESSGGRGDNIGKSVRTENINAFCRKIEELGYKAGVYANKKWFTKYIDTSSLGDWKIWLAQYKVRTPSYEGDYDIWQYSSKGHVDGIDGYVDLNVNLK